MDYEKFYKEALERARVYWETDNDNTLDIKAKGTMEYLFPELAEDGDEKIRKSLIEIMYLSCEQGIAITKENRDKYIAWLGKHHYTEEDMEKAYKTVDEVQYNKGFEDGIASVKTEWCDSEGESWPNLSTCLHDCKKCKDKCFYRKERYQGEQKPTLTWEDIDKLEDIINQVHSENPNGISAENFGMEVIERFMEEISSKKQKPAEWGEDEKIRKELIDMVNYIYADEERENLVAWLERQGEQKPIKLSENDKKIRSAIYRYLDWLDGKKDCAPQEEYTVRDMKIWLTDFLYPEIKAEKELVEQKSIKWTEEDENIKNTLIASLVRISANTRTDSTSVNYSFIKEINWLKSLKKRLQ